MFAADRVRTVRAAADVGLPSVFNEQGYAEAGGLISYGFDRKATYISLASVADLLLRACRCGKLQYRVRPRHRHKRRAWRFGRGSGRLPQGRDRGDLWRGL